MEDKKVQELADTLKERGLAASMADAIEKAKNIMYGIAPTPKTIDKPKVQKPIERNNSDKIKEIEKDISPLESQQDNSQKTFNPNNSNYDLGKETGTLNDLMNKFKEPELQPAQPIEQQPVQQEIQQEQQVQPQAEQQTSEPTQSQPIQQAPKSEFEEETNFIGTMDEEPTQFYDEDPFSQPHHEPHPVQQPIEQQPVQQSTQPESQPVHQPTQPVQQQAEQQENLPLTKNLLHDEEPTQPVQPQVQQPTQPQPVQPQVQPETQQASEPVHPEKEEEEKSGLTKEEKEKTDLSKIFNFGNR